MARYGFAATRARGMTLDLGCGVGYGAAIISAKKSVDFLIAFDISDNALAFGKSSYGETISFVAGDAGALPFSDDSLDSIVCLEAIEHVHGPERVLGEIARVLRPEGLLIISTPNKWATSPLSRRPINPHHVREWYPGRFKELVRRNFEVVEVLGQSWQPVGITWRSLRRRMRIRVKGVLRSLRILGIAQRLRDAGRRGLMQQESHEASSHFDVPTEEEVLGAWPRSWTRTRKQGIPITVILIARPLRRS
jgi:SAM-dependent methyltransferase